MPSTALSRSATWMCPPGLSGDPGFHMNRVSHTALGDDRIASGYGFDGFSASVPAPHIYNVSHREFCASIVFEAWVIAAAFALHVMYVGSLVSDPEMVGIDAHAVVAGVADEVFTRVASLEQDPRHPVSEHRLFIEAERSVPSAAVLRSDPSPASRLLLPELRCEMSKPGLFVFSTPAAPCLCHGAIVPQQSQESQVG